MIARVAVQAADWPRFLGPQANNVSSETGLLKRWPTEGPPVVWEREVGSGYSAPSVAGERLVLHHRLQDEELVEAFDARTGKPLWRHSYPSHFRDPFGYNNGPRCTPLLSSNRCYTFGAEGRLLCLNLQTGDRVWQRDTAKDWSVPEAFFGVGSTPLLEGKLCKPKPGEEAVLSFDGGCLHIECAGMTVTPSAQGCWPAQIRIPAPFLIMLAKMPPHGDPIEFVVQGNRLQVGSSSVGCSVQPLWSKTIELPMNPSFSEILALHFTHSASDIEAAGYSHVVQDALTKVDDQIQNATNALSNLPITRDELSRFVHATIARKISEGLIP